MINLRIASISATNLRIANLCASNLRTPHLRIILAIVLSVTVTASSIGQNIDHWESIVKTGHPVKYLVPTGPVPGDWITPGFNDAGWTDGINGVGYGDDDDNTVVECNTVYVRNRFNVSDKGVIEGLILDMDFDDGFVAYLNGVEIARYNMGAAFSATSWDQFSSAQVEEMPPGSYRFPLEAQHISLLINGENVLCVEVHNRTATSSDLSSNTYLSAGINNSNTYFSSLPDWFIELKDYISTLPLMMINTNGQEILKDSRIVADMGLIYNGDGVETFPTDSFNHYDGKISIKIRGNTSSNFKKRPYTIELQTDSGTNNNVSLLGLPKENDFVLNGPYSDKSHLRNVLAFEIFLGMGHWAPRSRFIELYLNDEYRGVYVLLEKVKIDKNRVAIHQLTEADVSPSDISGGYLLQVDRTNDLEVGEYWTSPVDPLYGKPDNTFEYNDPDRDELTTAQADYIKNWINSFDAVMASSNFKDPNSGYRAYIDVRSFVDYLILHEINKDVDAFRLSTYYHKANDAKGGKLHAGPPWDYNIAFGNVDYGNENWETYNFLYPSASRYWWRRLMEDPYFENEVICRWNYLTNTILNEHALHAIIDSSINVMGTSIEHNFVKWQILGVYIWPNYFIGDTYEEEIDFLKNWLSGRLAWIDGQWGGLCVPTSQDAPVIKALTALNISPNPSDLSHTRIQVPEHQPGVYRIMIYDMLGKTVYSEEYRLDQYSGSIFLPDLSHLKNGIYLVSIYGEGAMYKGKMVRE